MRTHFKIGWGIWLLAVVSIIPEDAAGQERIITGNVLDAADSSPIPFTSISINGTSTGTIADIDGKFQLTTETNRPVNIIVSHLRYQTDSITLKPGQTHFTILLHELSATLEEIVVTGSSKSTLIRENPIAIEVVSSAKIARTLESNLIETLARNVPGLNTVSTGPNISKPFIRGLGYNRVLTLYDGLRQEGQQWGDEHGIEVDNYNIDRAEIIKGPASLLYGSDALAGVVSIFPFVPVEKDRELHGRALSEYQSNNGLFGNSLRFYQRNEHWQWVVSSSIRKARNYTNRIDGRVYNTGFEEKNLAGMLGYQNSSGQSHLNFTAYDDRQGIPDGSRDSISRNFTRQIEEGSSDKIKMRPVVSQDELETYSLSPLHQRITHYRIYADHKYRIGRGDVSVLTGVQQNIRKEYNHPTAPEQPGLSVRLNTLNYSARYNAPEFSNIEIAVGLNGTLQQNKNKDATDFPIPDYTLNDIGAYSFLQWKENSWTISGGFRYDHRSINGRDFYIRENGAGGFHEQAPNADGATLQFPALNQHFAGTSMSVGTTYRLNTHWNMKLNVSRGYRAPNIAEIASNGLDPGAHIVYIGNRNFVPEFNYQEDLGVTGIFDDFQTSLSIFNNNIRKYIYLTQVVDEAGKPIELVQGNKTFKYEQASAHLYGLEASFELHPRQLKGFALNTTLSGVVGKNTLEQFRHQKINGEYLPFIPPLVMLTSVQQEFKTGFQSVRQVTAKAEMDVHAAQHRYLALYATETATKSYQLFNFSLASDLHIWTGTLLQLQFQVNNLLDRAYQSNLSRLKYFEYYTASPNGRSGMYGMGRNFCVRMSLTF